MWLWFLEKKGKCYSSGPGYLFKHTKFKVKRVITNSIIYCNDIQWGVLFGMLSILWLNLSFRQNLFFYITTSYWFRLLSLSNILFLGILGHKSYCVLSTVQCSNLSQEGTSNIILWTYVKNARNNLSCHSLLPFASLLSD